MGCGCGRDEGRAGKTEVARGGWAEDARRAPATSLVCVVRALVRIRGGEGQHSIPLTPCWSWNLKRSEKLCRFHAERPGETQDIHEGNVPLAPFDSADVISVQVC